MLKDTWTNKVDGVDINSADDINQVAQAVIDLENKEVKITEEEADVSEATITLEDNHIYSFNSILNKLTVSFPETIKNGYTSALYFTSTPMETIPLDYSVFPSNVIFKGDSTENGKFIPESNTRYTMVFDYDRVNIIGYVSGVSL